MKRLAFVIAGTWLGTSAVMAQAAPEKVAGSSAPTSAPVAQASTAPIATSAPAVPATAPAALVAATAPTTQPSTEPAVATTAPTTSPLATTAPATQPATAPAVAGFGARASGPRPYLPPTRGMGRPMAAEFGVLNVRSIFFKGHFVPAPLIGPGAGPPPTELTTQPTTAPTPESEVVLDGVTHSDDQIVAFLENRSDQKVSLVHVGDAISNGHVTDITLDELDYQSGDKTVHVKVGQNLDGVTASAPPTTQPLAGPGGPPPGPGGGPSGAAPAPPGGPGGPPQSVPGVSNDLLERLRQRRLRELQGK